MAVTPYGNQDPNNPGTGNQPENPSNTSVQAPGTTSAGAPGQTSSSATSYTPPSSGAGNGASSNQSSASNLSGAPQLNDRKQTGTGFTNLNQYMNASQGNQLGAKVAGGVTNAANQASGNLQNAQNQFNTQSQANNLNTAANQQEVANTINQANAGQDVNQQAVQDFAKFRLGQYAGPTTLQNQDQLVNQAQNAQTLGGLSSTAAGRQALLQRYVGGNGYSQGDQQLDNLLLGQGSNAQLNAARAKTQNLGSQAQNAANTAAQQAQYYGNQAQAFGNQTKNTLNTNLTNESSALSSQATQANNARDTMVANLQKNWGTQGLTDAQMAAVGVDPTKSIYTENLGDYITRDALMANQGNVANAQNYAQAQNLGKLTGSDVNSAGSALLANLRDPSQAGAFNADVGVTNKDLTGFNTNLAQDQKNYLNSLIAGGNNSAVNNLQQVGDALKYGWQGTAASNSAKTDLANLGSKGNYDPGILNNLDNTAQLQNLFNYQLGGQQSKAQGTVDAYNKQLDTYNQQLQSGQNTISGLQSQISALQNGTKDPNYVPLSQQLQQAQQAQNQAQQAQNQFVSTNQLSGDVDNANRQLYFVNADQAKVNANIAAIKKLQDQYGRFNFVKNADTGQSYDYNANLPSWT